MNFVTKRNTFLFLLCCILIVGSIGVSHSIGIWDWITGAKDVVEGIERLIEEMKTDIQEAEDEIAKQQDRKNGYLVARNISKARILPKEQEQAAAEKAGTKAANDYNDASASAQTLRDEIAALEEEIRWLMTYVSPSDPRISEMTADLVMKNGALASEEKKMSDAKQDYNAARSRVKAIKNELRGERSYITWCTVKINACDRKITALNQKITDLRQAIIDEEARRDQVIRDNAAEEDEFEDMDEQSRRPPE